MNIGASADSTSLTKCGCPRLPSENGTSKPQHLHAPKGNKPIEWLLIHIPGLEERAATAAAFLEVVIA